MMVLHTHQPEAVIQKLHAYPGILVGPMGHLTLSARQWKGLLHFKGLRRSEGELHVFFHNLDGKPTRQEVYALYTTALSRIVMEDLHTLVSRITITPTLISEEG